MQEIKIKKEDKSNTPEQKESLQTQSLAALVGA